jgi:glutamyl-tRNA synthetase
MHVGSVRTALYAWLFARKHGGTFILRIEDTDKGREVEGSIEHIVESLTWLGLTWDKGPVKQSDRLAAYHQWARVLLERGFAYPDPYTPRELEALRARAEEEKRPFLFREHRPQELLPWDGKAPLRFRVPEIKRFEWYDIVRGQLSAGEEALDDFILIKGDGYPTYNFAHIIDDHDMEVTHIMRGEEFISSTPKFLSLYDALGFERPYLATMPVILGSEGTKKLSKRDGAKDILSYRSDGYLPEAMCNFLALLGWHPEGNQEIMSMNELIESFNISKLQKGGAHFDETKLEWINHEHMKRVPLEEYVDRLRLYMRVQGEEEPGYLTSIAHLLQERATTFGEAVSLLQSGEFSFMERAEPTAELLLQGAKADETAVREHLQQLYALLEAHELFTQNAVKEAIFPYATQQGRASVLWPMRVALSGKEKSPDPFILASLLGKETTLRRIEAALHLF